MDHQEVKRLISRYHDGELSNEEEKALKQHLSECPDCRREFNEMSRFEEVMKNMELKKPQKEVWKIYWHSVYNRLERNIGWILLSIGAIVLLFYGGYKIVEGIIENPTTPLFLKVGILISLAGIVILFVSLLREQLFVRKRERYKEVEK